MLAPITPKHAPRPTFEKSAFEKPAFEKKAREFDRPQRTERPERPAFPKKERSAHKPEAGLDTFRIEVGYDHGVKPGNIVGAVANEAGLESKNIGRIEIFEDHSLIDLPSGMPPEIMRHLKTVWCAGQQLRITRDGEPPDNAGRSPSGKPFAGKKSFGEKKAFGDKPPFKPKRDFHDKPFGAGKPKPKPHRKGPPRES